MTSLIERCSIALKEIAPVYAEDYLPRWAMNMPIATMGLVTADELFLSRYTVVRHVSNIFAKTGAVNRAEATGYAHERRLTAESAQN